MKQKSIQDIWSMLKELGLIETKGGYDISKNKVMRELIKPETIKLIKRYLAFSETGLSKGDVVLSKLDNKHYIVQYQLFNSETEEMVKVEVVGVEGAIKTLNQNEFILISKRIKDE